MKLYGNRDRLYISDVKNDFKRHGPDVFFHYTESQLNTVVKKIEQQYKVIVSNLEHCLPKNKDRIQIHMDSILKIKTGLELHVIERILNKA